jgi:hypothetical protein
VSQRISPPQDFDMPRLASALLAASVAALMGGFACLGAATATGDPTPEVNTLAGALSRGYNSDNCAAQPPPGGALAVIQCGQNSDPNGPAGATYVLFGNAADTTGAFKASTKDMAPANCGEVESPTVWGQQQGTTAGQVACGTAGGVAVISWTNDAKNVLCLVRGATAEVPALYGWWRTRG